MATSPLPQLCRPTPIRNHIAPLLHHKMQWQDGDTLSVSDPFVPCLHPHASAFLRSLSLLPQAQLSPVVLPPAPALQVPVVVEDTVVSQRAMRKTMDAFFLNNRQYNQSKLERRWKLTDTYIHKMRTGRLKISKEIWGRFTAFANADPRSIQRTSFLHTVGRNAGSRVKAERVLGGTVVDQDEPSEAEEEAPVSSPSSSAGRAPARITFHLDAATTSLFSGKKVNIHVYLNPEAVAAFDIAEPDSVDPHVSLWVRSTGTVGLPSQSCQTQ